MAGPNSIINTIAGNGTAGYNSTGNALATTAMLDTPGGLTTDPAGNIYVTVNYRVRRILASDGSIHTVAGNGTPGYSGDNGPALQAQLTRPAGIDINNYGSLLFVSDSVDNVVRLVNLTSGNITTVAGTGVAGFSGDGGPATAAQLKGPVGVALSYDGRTLLIVDRGNQRIRKVDLVTGIITTVVGIGVPGYSGDSFPGTVAQVDNPSGITFGYKSSTLAYFADTGNNAIRTLDLTNGIVERFAGTGFPGSGGDGGLAIYADLNAPVSVSVDPTGEYLVFTDTGNQKLRRVQLALSSLRITELAGVGPPAGFYGDGGVCSLAIFNTPSGVTHDNRGNVFISDTLNQRVRKITASHP